MADESAGASQTGASSSGNHAAGSQRRTLDDVMRSPSTNAPGVVVLDTTHEEKSRKNSLNPREDLWMSTIDGYDDLFLQASEIHLHARATQPHELLTRYLQSRYNSPIIPIHVGVFPDAQTFYVRTMTFNTTSYHIAHHNHRYIERCSPRRNISSRPSAAASRRPRRNPSVYQKKIRRYFISSSPFCMRTNMSRSNQCPTLWVWSCTWDTIYNLEC